MEHKRILGSFLRLLILHICKYFETPVSVKSKVLLVPNFSSKGILTCTIFLLWAEVTKGVICKGVCVEGGVGWSPPHPQLLEL